MDCHILGVSMIHIEIFYSYLLCAAFVKEFFEDWTSHFKQLNDKRFKVNEIVLRMMTSI